MNATYATEDTVMKIITSIIVWIGLSLSMIATVFAADVREPYGIEYKYGSQLLIKQSPLQKEMRNAFVEPYLERIEIRNTLDDLKAENPTYLKAWIIADDRKGYKVFFNQNTNKFGLAKYKSGSISYTSEALKLFSELTKVFMARK